ncbi:response regulator [Reichenbachiella versicolor]|uniref:response regulator n=1 Tax=Reichenbachiella versicolor TaxID=1821036 RepID=UPI000D6DEB67|nr:response regulator [Reichenbachiella versicolor]
MPKVYVIDDDPFIHKLMNRMLSDYDVNIEVEFYKDGYEGIEALKSSTQLPDLIFLDVFMPNLDGWGFAEKYINTQIPKVPVYILSSSVDRRDIDRAKSIPLIKGYKIKPMKREELKEVCDKYLKCSSI